MTFRRSSIHPEPGPASCLNAMTVAPPTNDDINSVDRDVASELRPALLAAERLRLEALGATYKRQASGMAEETWIEMYDPEGNWFCVQ